MAHSVEMPELGESVTEGTVTQWLKKVGDTVAVDEPLLEVSTDKVDTEIPSPAAGVLLKILADEDDTVDVGAVIAEIGDEGETPAEPAAEEKAEPAEEEAPAAEQAEEPAEKPAAEPAAAPAASGDTTDIAMPELGESVTEGTVTQWLKKVGDTVEVDEPLLEVSTDKVDTEVPSPVAGTLVEILADEDDTVDVGETIARIGDPNAGVGGRIRKQDVLAAAGETSAAEKATAAATAAPAQRVLKGVDPAKASLRGTTQKVNRIRAITAKTTLESLHGAAQLTQVHEVDMTRVAELRTASKEAFEDKHGVHLTYLPFFAKAIVEALVAHPNVNASYNAETQEMTYHEQVNLSIAVDTKEGLISPVIHNAQDLSLPELAAAIVDIADRARNKKLKPNDISGGTFTITNIGSEGALTDTPILVPPQAAMIGTGAIVKRPVVISEDGQDAISIRRMVYLPMTYDHQVVDGADAGRFLTTVKDRLENTDFTADLGL
jgi:2-oxoglutarate dehydrogenase E2 component (dihydrolipoamide succinyltransferase)